MASRQSPFAVPYLAMSPGNRFQSTFPDRDHLPAKFKKGSFIMRIARNVSLNLLFPKGAVGLQQAEFWAMFMAAPEAAVNEYHDSVFRQNDVRPTGQRAVLGAIYCESVAKPVKHRAHRKLRFGVTAADA